MTTKRKHESPLVVALDAWLDGFTIGKRKSGVLAAGDVELEISVHVRRPAADPVDITRWHQEAVELCKREIWRMDRCSSTTARKALFSSLTRTCARECTHVLVIRSLALADKRETVHFSFRCAQHADQERDNVVAMFPFLGFELEQLRKQLRQIRGR